MDRNTLSLKMKKLTLIIEPTYDCNMRCKHCYHSIRGYHHSCLPVEEAIRFFELTTRNRRNVELLFHGGEPTLVGVKWFINFFHAIKPIVQDRKLILKSIIQTNGLLLTNSFLDILVDNQVRIGISFDGLHNHILRDYTETVFANIQLARHKNAYVVALCVETAKTIRNIIRNYDWFKAHSINYKIMPFFRARLSNKYNEYMIKPENYVSAMIELYKYWLTDVNVTIHVQTLESFLSLFSDSQQRIPIGGTCVGNCLTLMPDGTIWPCNRPLPQKYCLGKLDGCIDSKEWFTSQGFHAINVLQREHNHYCKSCQFYAQCHTGCIAHAIEEGYPIQCEGETCIRTQLLLSQLHAINVEVYSTGKYRGHPINPYAKEIVERNSNRG